jgi:hypothetical protein
MGGPKSNLGDIHYKQLAARVAGICRFNRIGYVLIAGSGKLRGRIRPEAGGKPMLLTAPTQQFVSVRQIGNRRLIQGCLFNALQKSGVTPLLATPRARNIWVKPFLQRQTVDGCVIAHAFHEEPAAEDGRSYTGKRTLISPDEKTPGFPYPLNAAWAILLDWSVPDFSKHVEHTLATQADH